MREQENGEGLGHGCAPVQIRVFIVSPVRIYREGLLRALSALPTFAVVGSAETAEVALRAVQTCRVDVALYDLRCHSGLRGLRMLADAPQIDVVALGVEESVEWVLACAEAGIAGYVTDNSSLDELVTRVADAARGEFRCPPHIAASLLRRLAAIGPLLESEQTGSRLTSRELEVAALLQAGLTNRQIATRLTIQLPTVKNHVHSILRKLQAPTRRDAVTVLRTNREGPRPRGLTRAGV